LKAEINCPTQAKIGLEWAARRLQPDFFDQLTFHLAAQVRIIKVKSGDTR
jgi:hypothetical protein